jgi:hypothetical protein
VKVPLCEFITEESARLVTDSAKKKLLPCALHTTTGASIVSTCAGVFASGGEDELVAVWDLERKEAPQAAAAAAFSEEDAKGAPEAKRARLSALPPQLMYQHAGHRCQARLLACCAASLSRNAACWPLSRLLG